MSFKESTLEKEEILKAVGKLSEKVDRLTTNAPLIKEKICSLCCSKDHEDGRNLSRKVKRRGRSACSELHYLLE